MKKCGATMEGKFRGLGLRARALRYFVALWIVTGLRGTAGASDSGELHAICAHYLGGRPLAVKPFLFRERLAFHGISPRFLRFDVWSEEYGAGRPEKPGPFAGRKGMTLSLTYRGGPVGLFTMIYFAESGSFESHVHLEEDFRGQGLGMMLYVLGAKIAHDDYGALLVASPRPSPEASRLWKFAINNGWASPGRRSSFRPDVVERHFDDLYTLFKSRQHGDLPSRDDLEPEQ